MRCFGFEWFSVRCGMRSRDSVGGEGDQLLASSFLGVPFLRCKVWGKHQRSPAQSAWVPQVSPQLVETMSGDVLEGKLCGSRFRAYGGATAEVARAPFPF